ncbi:hypothetical protein ARMGADRAFT_292393 [Armillaria gallica]|uniref:Uncharacterized protein n=1 Tax=Armillaria gallica TaxID=47427 RepID=A0A2H3D6B7_ARMGA|nr:hypothetical protein ARMGADRAFT_292393 [Armillaria gallica]
MNEATDDILANFAKHRPDASKRLPLHDPIAMYFPGPLLSRGGNNVRLTFEIEEDEDIDPSEVPVDPVSLKQTNSDDNRGVATSSQSRASERYTDLGESVFKIGFSDVKTKAERFSGACFHQRCPVRR